MPSRFRNFPYMYDRFLSGPLARSASRHPVVTLTGPRQSGKTTLVRSVFPDHEYISLERPDVRARVLDDPVGFLAQLDRSVILDEVQRAPDLLSYIQVDVDEDPRPGRFILTGSQNLLLMEGITQTLAGRTALLRLFPLSLAELLDRAHLDPSALESVSSRTAPGVNRWEVLWAGFYPRIHHMNLAPDQWLADYYRTYVERDLRDVLRVMDLDTFERFVRLTAARTGQELNLTSLAEDVGISQPTAKQWLTALRIGYLVTVLPPHHANFRKRMRKRPRLHFLDSGLVCYLLGIHDARTLENHPLRGAIFESFVVSEFVKAFEHGGREAPLFSWKDATGHEIDILVDLGERLLPIEVKSGLTVTPDAIAGLRWWTGLKGNPNKAGVLVHGGNDSFEMKGFRVLPWFLT